jgi:peptidoglycan-associated lipoprotein
MNHALYAKRRKKMRKNYWLVLALLLILPAMLLTVSCAKKAVQEEPAVSEEAPPVEQPVEVTPEPQGPSDEELAAQQAAMAQEQARQMFVSENIYFEFDSAALLPAAQQVLSTKADYLFANPDARVAVEGHCDERGTNAYNMALGQRRADAAKDFLVNLGIDAGRLSTISYGEEQPLDFGHNEEAWAKNRRAHFVLE